MTSPLASENAKLRDQVDELKARVEFLQGMFNTLGKRLPNEWGISGRQGRVVDLLVRAEGRTVATETLLQSIWPDDEPDSALKCLRVHILYARRKLAPHGIAICNVWGIGYAIERRLG